MLLLSSKKDLVKLKGIYSNSIYSLKRLLIDQLVSKNIIKRGIIQVLQLAVSFS